MDPLNIYTLSQQNVAKQNNVYILWDPWRPMPFSRENLYDHIRAFEVAFDVILYIVSIYVISLIRVKTLTHLIYRNAMKL